MQELGGLRPDFITTLNNEGQREREEEGRKETRAWHGMGEQ